MAYIGVTKKQCWVKKVKKNAEQAPKVKFI